jgi:hypothetical protein
MKTKIKKFIEEQLDFINSANAYALGMLTKEGAKERLLVLVGLADTIGDYDLEDRISNIYNHL